MYNKLEGNDMTEVLTTPQALLYIAEVTGRDKPVTKRQLNYWQNLKDDNGVAWLRRHTIGYDGKPNTYTIDALDELCRKINTNYRKKRNISKTLETSE